MPACNLQFNMLISSLPSFGKSFSTNKVKYAKNIFCYFWRRDQMPSTCIFILFYSRIVLVITTFFKRHISKQCCKYLLLKFAL